MCLGIDLTGSPLLHGTLTFLLLLHPSYSLPFNPCSSFSLLQTGPEPAGCSPQDWWKGWESRKLWFGPPGFRKLWFGPNHPTSSKQSKRIETGGTPMFGFRRLWFGPYGFQVRLGIILLQPDYSCLTPGSSSPGRDAAD